MKKAFLFLLSVHLYYFCICQCPPVDAGPNRTLCAGSTTVLGSFQPPIPGATYSWSPAQTLSASNVPNPIASPTTSTTYTLMVTVPNLITNGDFEQGLTGFTTDYSIYPTGDGGCGLTYGSIAVSTDPNSLAGGWCSYVDHTPGAGQNMLVVDGSCNANRRIWSQTVAVATNTTYNFSGWASSNGTDLGNPAFMPQLRVRINGTNVLTNFSVPYTGCTGWTNFTANWNSGSTTTATIEIYDDYLIGQGNDFNLDDLTFGCNGGGTDNVTINVSGVAVNVTPAGPIVQCHQYESVISNTLTSSAATLNQWYKNFTPIQGATGQSLVVSNTANNGLGTGYYTVHNRGCLSNTVYIEYKPYMNPNNPHGCTCGPIHYCRDVEGALVQADVAGVTGVTGSTYTWTITPPGATVTQANPTDNFATVKFPLNYPSNTPTVNISISQNGCVDAINYTVDLAPVGAVQYNKCTSTGSFVFDANLTTMQVDEWDFGPDAITSSTGTRYHTSNASGTTPDNITVTYPSAGTRTGFVRSHAAVPGSSGCHFRTAEFNITINSNCRIMNPGITGQAAPPPTQFQLTPNPASSVVTITGPAIDEVAIYNGAGHLLKRVKGNGSPQMTISTSEIPNGVYACKITGKNQQETLKLMILR